MNRTSKKRLQKVTRQIDALPIAPAAEEAAFEQFRETGELPEHQRLAEAVVKRTLQGGNAGQDKGPSDLATSLKIAARMAEGFAREDWVPKRNPLREQLFNEAVYGHEVIRLAARSVIKMSVAMEMDVCDPEFVDSRIELPDFGSLGLHMLGWPDCLVRSPHKKQARRLLKRCYILRERIDHDDRQWFDDMNHCLSSWSMRPRRI